MDTMSAGCMPWQAPSVTMAPLANGNGGRSLFAKGLAKGCTSAHLHAIFSQFGTVTDCQIARHRSGRSAGFAVVTFLHHEEAVAAMQSADNLMFMGRRLNIRWFSPERALEGGNGADVMAQQQALVAALQHLSPSDLMVQLAHLLDAPAPAQQRPAAHVNAWLDTFGLPQQAPLVTSGRELAPGPSPTELLNLSSLSLIDNGPMPAPNMPGSSPTTPSSLDLPDGAVFVTAGISNSRKPAAPVLIGAPVVAATNASVAPTTSTTNMLASSRLAKWCSAPGSVIATSSPPSLSDDAASDTASIHHSDDASIATTAQNPSGSCGMNSGTCTGTSSPVFPGSGGTPTVPPTSTAVATVADCPISEDAARPHLLPIGPATSRHPAGASDPGARRASGPGLFMPPQPILPNAPVLPAAHAAMPHFTRSAPGSRPPMGPFPPPSIPADPRLRQAMQLQHALAEQARNSAQQQYADALSKLAAAREQMMAAASMLNNPMAGLQQMPSGMPPMPPQMMMGHGQANPFMVPQPPSRTPDFSAYLMMQNGGSAGRPMY